MRLSPDRPHQHTPLRAGRDRSRRGTGPGIEFAGNSYHRVRFGGRVETGITGTGRRTEELGGWKLLPMIPPTRGAKSQLLA